MHLFPEVSLARQVQTSEMGGQHEAGGVDPESTSVPVQRAFYRGLLWYPMGHPLPEEHSHPNHFPLYGQCMYLSCFSPINHTWGTSFKKAFSVLYTLTYKIIIIWLIKTFLVFNNTFYHFTLFYIACNWSGPIWLLLLCSACTLPHMQ